MAYITFYINGRFYEPLARAVSIKTNVPELKNFCLKNECNYINILNEHSVLASVSEFEILSSEFSASTKKIGFLKWAWVFEKNGLEQRIVLSKELEYSIGDRVVAKIIDGADNNVFSLLWRFIFPRKSMVQQKKYIKIEFDSDALDPLFAYCLLMRKLLRKYSS